MEDLLKDPKINGALLSLGYHKPKNTSDIETPESHKQMMGDNSLIMAEYKTKRYNYGRNKKGINLEREVTTTGEGVDVDGFIFNEENTQGGFLYTPSPKRRIIQIHSNEQILYELILKSFQKMGTREMIHKYLLEGYNQLIGYLKK